MAQPRSKTANGSPAYSGGEGPTSGQPPLQNSHYKPASTSGAPKQWVFAQLVCKLRGASMWRELRSAICAVQVVLAMWLCGLGATIRG
eukprot:2010307-Pyramimonas_sp.AAC.1